MGEPDWLAPLGAPALVDCVKLAQREGLKGPGGAEWKAFVQSLPAAQRHQDPSRHAREQLASFLSAAAAADGGAARLLRRYAEWRAAAAEEAAAEKRARARQPAANGGAAAPSNSPAWRLVARTRAHPKFARLYSFPSYEKGWLRTSRLRPEGAAPDARPRLLALDCEMCATSEGPSSLLALAVTDEAGAVLMRELVKPPGKVLDLRTAITGITEADLKGVTLKRKDVAARLAALLGPDTVLVGHSLSADLRALKLDHQPVIDTALLFSYKGLSQATPSLVHLAQALLGRALRGGEADSGGGGEGGGGGGVHDSREDASAAMALALHEMAAEAAGESTAPLDPPAVKVDKSDLSKLLVHSVPPSLPNPSLAITHAFGAAGAPPPAAVEPGPSGAPGQLLLSFPNPAVANEAFAALPGPAGTDSVGRQQKQLVLAGGAKVRVRKMACHAGELFGRDAPRDRGEAKPKKGKGKGKGKSKGKGTSKEEGPGGGGGDAAAASGAAAAPAQQAAGGGGERKKKRKRDCAEAVGGGDASGGAASNAAAAAAGVAPAAAGAAAASPGGRDEKRRQRAQRFREGLVAKGSSGGGGGGGTAAAAAQPVNKKRKQGAGGGGGGAPAGGEAGQQADGKKKRKKGARQEV